MKKILISLLMALTIGAAMMGMAACDVKDWFGDSSQKEQVKKPSVGLEYEFTYDGDYWIVTGIGDCTNKEIVIPSTYYDLPVKEIGAKAFYECSDLTVIVIPDSVTSIGFGAFWGCSQLVDVEIGNGVTSIGGNAFYGCGLVELVIPDSVTSIGDEAFLACKKLEKVEIPDSITNIEGNAFSFCESLSHVEIPNTLTSISQGMFSYCRRLNYVEIPDSVTSIGTGAFHECVNLTGVVIGKNVESIGMIAFNDCYKLVEVYNKSSLNIVAGNNEDYGEIGAYVKNVYTKEGGGKLVTDKNGFMIYNGDYLANYIGNQTEIVIPDGVKSIGQYAFWIWNNKPRLTKIEIPDSVIDIGERAFYYCYSLLEVNFKGTMAQWEAIEKNRLWDVSCSIDEVICLDGTVTL